MTLSTLFNFSVPQFPDYKMELIIVPMSSRFLKIVTWVNTCETLRPVLVTSVSINNCFCFCCYHFTISPLSQSITINQALLTLDASIILSIWALLLAVSFFSSCTHVTVCEIVNQNRIDHHDIKEPWNIPAYPFSPSLLYPNHPV